MKNKLSDLNDILFAQLDALQDEDLNTEEFNREVERSKQVVSLGKTIVENAKVILDAQKHADEYGYTSRGREMPGLLLDIKK